MGKTNDGGPAFPRAPHSGDASDDGMSLRDYIAAQAIAGSADRIREMIPDECKVIAENAYKIADAVLAERDGGDD